jgi:DNA segregation ATPase FtsK/SpoIIIE-like protein
MDLPAIHDPMFQTVRQWVLESRNPSVFHAQKRLKLPYRRVAAMMGALEGDLVTEKDQDGWRRMLSGETASWE